MARHDEQLLERSQGESPNAEQAIETRIRGLSAWVEKNATGHDEPAHLNEGSPERAYWHRGYLQALRDVRDLLDGRRRTLN